MIAEVEESHVSHRVEENHDHVVDDHRGRDEDHVPTKGAHLVALIQDPAEEDQGDAKKVEENFIDHVLSVYQSVDPLGFDHNEGHHDYAGKQKQESSKEGSLSDHEQDHDCVEDPSKDESKRVYDRHVVGTIPLKAVEKSPIGQFGFDHLLQSDSQLCFILD